MPLICSRKSLFSCSPLAIAASVFACGSAAGILGAQTVTPRTVPVQTGQQYDILPSDRAGMGNVRIAIDDEMLDPFVNPAKAVRLRTGILSVAPYFVHQSDERGGGKTLPLSGIAPLGKWSVGGQFSIQQLDRTRLTWNAPNSERSASNQYATGILARSFDNGIALGASAYVASLEAQQGIDQLYSGSDRIVQSGSMTDLRLGMTRAWGEGKNFELMALRSRFDMTHDVHFPAFVQFTPPNTRTPVPERSEHNRDYTTSWGAHSEYSAPVGKEGWKVGFLGTVNRLSHPKIPDYRINQVITVPRDPGHTWAYNAGLGLAYNKGINTFALDVIYEPMFSKTWAEAANDTISASGAAILKGGHTVDNKFRFSNSLMRVGFEVMKPKTDSGTHFGVQFGIGVNSIKYRLWQTDLVRDTSRIQNENWMEWNPTLGFKLRNPNFEVRYSASMTCGAGGDCTPPVPGCGFGCGDDVTAPAPGGGGVIAAPTDVLRFNGGRVIAQRITITLKLR